MGICGTRLGEGCSSGLGVVVLGAGLEVGRRTWGFSRCHFFSQLLVPAHLLSMPLLERKTQIEGVMFFSASGPFLTCYSCTLHHFISSTFKTLNVLKEKKEESRTGGRIKEYNLYE